MKEKKTYETVKTPIYGNWMVKHPSGHLMFYGDEKKANWYLNRNLAVLIGENTIQLTFIPKGNGSAMDLYGSSPKENICVVCGDTNELTRHHIVPYCYRKYFPEEYKSNNFHDVVPVCGLHHKEYEVKASELKRIIGNQYGMVTILHEKMSSDLIEKRHIGGYLLCLIEKRAILPKERLKEMEDRVLNYFKLEKLPNDLNELYKKIEVPKTTYKNKRETSKFKLIVAKIESIQEFVEQWRKHFIECMNPKHLPNGWDIKRDARRLEWIITNNQTV